MKFHHTPTHAAVQPYHQINTSTVEWTKKCWLPKAIKLTSWDVSALSCKDLTLRASGWVWAIGGCGENCTPVGAVGSLCVLHHQRTCHWPCVIAVNRTDKGDPGFWSGPTTLPLAGLIFECHHSGGLLPPEAMQRGQVITERPSKCSSQSQLGSSSYSVWSEVWSPLSIFTDTLNIWRGPAPTVWTVTRSRPNTHMSRKRVPQSVHSLIMTLQLCQLDVTQSCYTPETLCNDVSSARWNELYIM